MKTGTGRRLDQGSPIVSSKVAVFAVSLCIIAIAAGCYRTAPPPQQQAAPAAATHAQQPQVTVQPAPEYAHQPAATVAPAPAPSAPQATVQPAATVAPAPAPAAPPGVQCQALARCCNAIGGAAHAQATCAQLPTFQTMPLGDAACSTALLGLQGAYQASGQSVPRQCR